MPNGRDDLPQDIAVEELEHASNLYHKTVACDTERKNPIGNFEELKKKGSGRAAAPRFFLNYA